MKLFKLLLVFFFLANIGLSNAQDDNLQSKIAKNLRCLVCQGQSIYDSDSEFASSVKILIEKKIENGENEKQIYDYLKNKYGEWILYEPDFSKNTYILWILPIIVFLIGGFVIFRLFITKKKNYSYLNEKIIFYIFGYFISLFCFCRRNKDRK